MITSAGDEAIYVRWIDSSGIDGWVNRDSLEFSDQMQTIETVGYLVEEHNDRIVVASSVSKEQINSPLIIPKIAILERKTL